jgi:hypothetical protein
LGAQGKLRKKDSFTTEEKIKDEVEQKIVIATAHTQIYPQKINMQKTVTNSAHIYHRVYLSPVSASIKIFHLPSSIFHLPSSIFHLFLCFSPLRVAQRLRALRGESLLS